MLRNKIYHFLDVICDNITLNNIFSVIYIIFNMVNRENCNICRAISKMKYTLRLSCTGVN